jgi:hypothetical protein
MLVLPGFERSSGAMVVLMLSVSRQAAVYEDLIVAGKGESASFGSCCAFHRPLGRGTDTAICVDGDGLIWSVVELLTYIAATQSMLI